MQTNGYTRFASIEDFKEENRGLIAEYLCLLCRGIYFNPVIDSCGHIFCESCFNVAYSKSQSCPIEGTPLKGLPMKIALLSTILDKQIIYCRNKNKGCDWSGLYKELSGHLSTDCLKESLKCLYDQCSSSLLREEYASHLDECPYKTIECEECHMKLLSSQFQEHEGKCSKRKIKCNQGCNQSIERDALASHLMNGCTHTLLDCPYAKFGCSEKFKRKDMDQMLNEGMSRHLLLLSQSFVEFERKFDALEKHVANIGSIPLQSPPIWYIKKEKREAETYLGKKRNYPSDNEVISLLDDNMSDKSNIDLTVNNISNTNKNSKPNEEPITIQDDCDVFQIEDSPFLEQESLFDKNNLGHYFKITHNRALYDAPFLNEHKCLLGSKAIENNKSCITSWTLTLLTQSYWIAFGICDKERVLQNNLDFYHEHDSDDHGGFLFSSNGYTWNCNNREENNKSVNMPDVNKGDKLSFQYKPSTHEFTLNFKNYTETLTRVYPLKGNKLTLCVVFLHPKDEIQVDNYKSTFHITNAN